MKYICILLIGVLAFAVNGNEPEKLYPHRHNSFFGGISWGLCNEQGEIRVPDQYMAITEPRDGLSIGFLKSGKKMLINDCVEERELNYTCIQPFSEKIAAVQKNWKWGYINEKMENIIAPEYDDAKPFSDGYAAVKKAGKWGYIDPANKPLCDFIYDRAYRFHDGYAVVEKDGLRGAINRSGELMIPIKYKRLGRFGDGLFPASNDEKVWFFIDTHDVPHLQNNYIFAYSFDNGAAVVRNKEGRCGAIDKNGKILIPFDYAELSNFSGKFYAYGEGSRPDNIYYGFMDQNGKKLTSPKFTDAQVVDSNIFMVARKRKILHNNQQNSTVISPEDIIYLKLLPDGKIVYFGN